VAALLEVIGVRGFSISRVKGDGPTPPMRALLTEGSDIENLLGIIDANGDRTNARRYDVTVRAELIVVSVTVSRGHSPQVGQKYVVYIPATEERFHQTHGPR
jgi:hypothetical protein